MENLEQQPLTQELSNYWKEKGDPKEQFEITLGGKEIELKNFSELILSDEQIRELRKVIVDFSKIRDGIVFDDIHFILVDDRQPKNSSTGEELNGLGAKEDGAVKLYPHAIKPIPHRVRSVSNFEGTLIHEFTHTLQDKAITDYYEWINKFGWEMDNEKIEEYNRLKRESPNLDPNEMGLASRLWKNSHPERCVTGYAKLGPEDDLADSLVAALRDPEKLDPEKLRFIKEKFLDNAKLKESPKIKIDKK